jgi:hypothetical protein
MRYQAVLLGGRISGKLDNNPGKKTERYLRDTEGSNVSVVNVAAHKCSSDLDSGDYDKLFDAIIDSDLDNILILVGAHNLHEVADFLATKEDLVTKVIILMAAPSRLSGRKKRRRARHMMRRVHHVFEGAIPGLYGIYKRQGFNPLKTFFHHGDGEFAPRDNG